MIESDICDRLTWDIEVIRQLNGNESKLIVCGIVQLKDYVPNDIGRHTGALPDDYTLVILNYRESPLITQLMIILTDFCIQTGLRVANGRVGEDATEGKCTYVGSSVSSLIDYVIVSQEILKSNQYFISQIQIFYQIIVLLIFRL